jgi:hypothetical protein
MKYLLCLLVALSLVSVALGADTVGDYFENYEAAFDQKAIRGRSNGNYEAPYGGGRQYAREGRYIYDNDYQSN